MQVIVPQADYATVYVATGSEADVYFDDATVEHRSGLRVQESQYDSTGLDLAGVSGAAPGLRLKNYYQFNGKENQLELGLRWNHQDWRFYDYQLNRWHGLDPLIEDGQENWTPYAFSYNNAVRFSDPDGQFPPLVVAAAGGAAIGAIVGAGIEAGTQMYQNGGHVKDWHAVGGAALQGGVTGAVAGLTGGTSLLRSGAAGAVSNVAGGIARNVHDGKPITVGSVTKDAAIGAAAGVGGALAARAVGKIVVSRTLQSMARTTKGPAKVGVAYDRTTGKIYKDVSGQPHPELAPALEAQAPNPSLEQWKPCNCAETKAANQAVNAGSKLKNLTVGAAKTKKGTLVAPCENCQETLKGVRFITPPQK
jgi:RHS repeat-associated protein